MQILWKNGVKEQEEICIIKLGKTPKRFFLGLPLPPPPQCLSSFVGERMIVRNKSKSRRNCEEEENEEDEEEEKDEDEEEEKEEEEEKDEVEEKVQRGEEEGVE